MINILVNILNNTAKYLISIYSFLHFFKIVIQFFATFLFKCYPSLLFFNDIPLLLCVPYVSILYIQEQIANCLSRQDVYLKILCNFIKKKKVFGSYFHNEEK
ncbi:unnamed protein product [Cryptosporidium hominis]|uniref:Transmembrane protein n=1 Tax=Cryptosporidium hominis TaxID=237895 RepID=A0A0S4TAT9_CRYHO|nr:Uncharacterized protein GY17_00001356 [Cryptosporidium hominis]CUV04298.1 unnamed protein product [Cryptosporidium hominis]|eukprot:PPS97198.1 Uncharacterized protein GY17_00001356 [Cryptosporidium hominis]